MREHDGAGWKWVLVLLGLAALGGYVVGQQRGRRIERRRDPLRRREEEQERWIARGIVGTGRGELAKRFGPPVTASGGDFWQAETWYYPVDREHHTGLAIRFNQHVAEDVEFIRPPG